MIPAHLTVHAAAVFLIRQSVDSAGEHMGSAEAAFTVAAVGVEHDARPLDGNRDRLIGFRRDHILLNAAHHRQIEGLPYRFCRISGYLGDVRRIIHHIVAESSLLHSQLLQRLIHKLVHSPGSAEQIGAAGGGIFLNNLLGDKAFFPLPVRIVGENMDDLNIRAFFLHCSQLFFQHNIV